MKCASTKDPHAIILLLPWYLRIYNVFKIQTGNVKITFPKDLLETVSPHVMWASVQHPFQKQCFLYNINAHEFSFSVRTAPVWNALPPASVYVVVHAILLTLVQIVFVLVQLIFKLVQNYWMEIKISVTVPRSVKQNKKVGQGIKKFDHNKAMPLSVKLRLTSKS